MEQNIGKAGTALAEKVEQPQKGILPGRVYWRGGLLPEFIKGFGQLYGKTDKEIISLLVNPENQIDEGGEDKDLVEDHH